MLLLDDELQSFVQFVAVYIYKVYARRKLCCADAVEFVFSLYRAIFLFLAGDVDDAVCCIALAAGRDFEAAVACVVYKCHFGLVASGGVCDTC